MDKSTELRRGFCLVIAAPSGAGKSTLCRAILAADPAISLSVSVTTRPPRPGEQDGVDYHFVSDSEFTAMTQDGRLLEWARVFGRGYGTPLAPVRSALAAGRDVLFDIDWQGWRQVKAALPDDSLGVFVLPPSIEALQSRLTGRAGDAPAEIARRMAAAAGELAHWREFDHLLVNDDLDRCLDALRSVLAAARTVTRRRTDLSGLLAALGA